MNYARMQEFVDAYQRYRREQNSFVDAVVALAAFAVVMCAVLGGYVVQEAGNDANVYSVTGLVLAVPCWTWLVVDLFRFAKLRERR